MVTWAEFTAEVPEFAAYVEERFRARKFLDSGAGAPVPMSCP